MWLFLNVLVFNVWLPKGEKEENERGPSDAEPLNPLEVTLVRLGRACNSKGRCNSNGLCLFVCTSVMKISSQWSGCRALAFVGQGPLTQPDSYKMCARCVRNTCTATWQVSEECTKESWHCAKSWYGYKLTIMFLLSLPLWLVNLS